MTLQPYGLTLCYWIKHLKIDSRVDAMCFTTKKKLICLPNLCTQMKRKRTFPHKRLGDNGEFFQGFNCSTKAAKILKNQYIYSHTYWCTKKENRVTITVQAQWNRSTNSLRHWEDEVMSRQQTQMGAEQRRRHIYHRLACLLPSNLLPWKPVLSLKALIILEVYAQITGILCLHTQKPNALDYCLILSVTHCQHTPLTYRKVVPPPLQSNQSADSADRKPSNFLCLSDSQITAKLP